MTIVSTRIHIRVALLFQLAIILKNNNVYVQSLVSLCDKAIFPAAPNNFQKAIHSNRRPSNEHVCRCNGTQASEIAAIILEAEDGIAGKQDIVMRCRRELNNNEAERFDTNSVTHRSHDSLSYILLLPYGTDGWYLGILQVFSSSFSRRHVSV